MKLLTSFVRGLLGLSTSTAPAESGPVFIQPPPEPVTVDALLDLALVMRDRWLPDAAFVEPKGEAEALVEAALARVFPDHVVTSENCVCAALDFPRAECPHASCPTPSEREASDARLSAFLAPIKRPDWTFNITLAAADQMAADLGAARLQIAVAEALGVKAKDITVAPAAYLVAP